MNPICLLTKGRTVTDMADRPSAYKLLAQGTIPKYSGGARLRRTPHAVEDSRQENLFDRMSEPVAAEPVQETAVQEKILEEAAPAPLPEIVGSVGSDRSVGSAEEPVVVSVNPFAATADKPKRSAARFLSAGGVWFKNLLSKRGPAGGAKTVQGELALEKVTVMRNDLNEDDLEVVLVERKVGTCEKPLARLSKMEMTSDAWLRLTAPFRKQHAESAANPQAEVKPSPELGARA